jgi:uroporphyrinogen-III synthase
VQELPEVAKDASSTTTTTVLYPASAQAASTLADGLTARGMHVTRLDTYDTVAACWTNEQRQLALQCQVACFASPSAVKAWVTNSAADDSALPLAACIGETSAQACRELGWKEDGIYYPKAPGMDGWMASIQEAAESWLRRRVQEKQQ